MNRKGMTLMEVLVSLVLIAIVMIFLTNLLADIKNEETISTTRNADSLTRASLINVIEGDLINNNLTRFYKNCNLNKSGAKACYSFTFSSTTKYLYVGTNFIAYGPSNSLEKWNLEYGEYDISNIKVNFINKVNGTSTPDYLLTIHIPVKNVDNTTRRKYDVDLTIIGKTDGFTCSNGC